MGMRANLAIVHEQGYQLYYCHWCANTLDQALFWGADYARAFIEQQVPVPAHDWLDTVWAEGGAVLDPLAKTLIFFGGEMLLYDIPLRRVYLALMQRLWQGWTVRWATQGIVDMAGYLGVPTTVVTASAAYASMPQIMLEPVEPNMTDGIISICDHDGRLYFVPTNLYLGEFLMQGSRILQFDRNTAIPHSFDLDDWWVDFPSLGIHADLSNQTLTIWHGHPFVISDAIRECWQGWKLHMVGDQFEEQIRLCEGRLIVPPVEHDLCIERLERMLVRDSHSFNPAHDLQHLVEQKRAEGKQVTVNPYTSRYDPSTVTLDTKQHLWEQAVSAWHITPKHQTPPDKH